MAPQEQDTMTELGCWVGIKRCGCYVAVVRDDANPDHAKYVEESKVQFIREGLQLVYATEAEWRDKYLPGFLEDCPHRQAEAR